jgi:osmotically-inducible protein OsmY
MAEEKPRRYIFSLLNVIVFTGVLSSCSTSPRVPDYNPELADVSLPVPIPAPRQGTDRENGTVVSPARPALERLTLPGTQKMMSDNRLRTEVLAAIVDDPAVDPFQFRYIVEDGKVRILGKGSHRQTSRVAETVARVRGVREVESEAQVPQSEQPSWAIPPSDEQIEREIQERIERALGGELASIDISIQEGQVLLLGTVRSWRTRQMIENAARASQGVRRVESEIEVKPKYVRENDRLSRDVKTALSFEPLLHADRIQVDANQGVVTLKGIVSANWKKERATDLAGQVFGVISIQNEIQVMPAGLLARKSESGERR